MTRTPVEQRDIYLPDGTIIKEGSKIYKVFEKSITSRAYAEKSDVRTYSGDVAHYVVEYVVAKVNRQENQRSFILRSDRGCEETLSVKNNCLPTLFSSKDKAVAEVKVREQKHVINLDNKIKRIEGEIEDEKKRLKKVLSTRKKLVANIKGLK